MKNSIFVLTLLAMVAPTAHAQIHTFTGTGNWLDDTLWDMGVVPPDGSTAVVNGDALIDQDIVTTQAANPGRVEIGNAATGSVTVTGGTLSGAHGNGGIFVGLNGGTGTLTVAQGATYRSQGAGMRIRIGDTLGGSGMISVAGVLQNYKILEIVNGTLEMQPTGQNNIFNSTDASSIGANGILSYVIDGPNVGALERSTSDGLNLTIDPAATLKITLDGTFAINDSWVLMDYTTLSGQFAQGTSFTNQQGYTFAIDYGSGNSDLVTLTLTSDAARPKIDAISATPAGISAGESSSIAWTTSNFDTLTLYPGGLNVTTLTSTPVSPAVTTTYTLSAALGAVTVTQDITVVVDELPVINGFAATETIIAPGDSTTLSWDVSGANTVTIAPAPGSVALVDSASVSPAATTTYTLTATNTTGSVMADVMITVDAIEAALIHRWDPAGPGQTSGAFLDSMGGKNFDMTGGSLATGLPPSETSLTATMGRVNPNANTGGDNGLGFPATDTTYELWVRTADIGIDPQVVFETGGPDNGTCILLSETGVRLMHSATGITTIDIEAPIEFINTGGDFIQIAASVNGVAGQIDLYVLGAGGGSASATGAGTVGVPDGRASIFTWSGFGGAVAAELGGVVTSVPIGTTTFKGTIGLINIYDRPFSAAEVDDAFLRIATTIITGDSDTDTLPDWWELQYFGNLAQGPDGKFDSDTLTNGEEFAEGTSPILADTDGDGLDDDDELDLTYPSDPNNPDTDGDLLTDGEEVNGTFYSDPTLEDTDFDGFWDVFEVTLGSDPDDINDLPTDDIGAPTAALHVAGGYASFDSSMSALDTADATFRLFVDFDDKPAGDREVLFETGGATVGISLCYEAGSQLVFRASGSGGFVLATATHTLTAAQIAAGELDVSCTYDVDDGSPSFFSVIALYIDGDQVGSQTADLGGDWTGTNAATFATASGNLAGVGDNTPLAGLDFSSGAINFKRGLAHYEMILTATPILITDIVRNPGTNEVTLTFDSQSGKTYAISKSTSLPTFTEVLSSIPSGGTSTVAPAITVTEPSAFFTVSEE